MKALVLAAGLGTRLKPLTDTTPKALIPVLGTPLIEILIKRLIANGCDEVVVNVHHFSQQIIDFLQQKEHFGISIHISDESEKLLDTGGAIKKAGRLFSDDTPFLVHNVDILHNLDLRAFYHQYAHQAEAVLIVSQRDTQRYLLFNDKDELVGWTNIKTGEVKSPFEEVKADAGVLVEAAPGTYDFVVAPNEADYASDLVGSVATKATSSFANTVYTLQSGPAFMQYNGENVTGFRSHIEVESAGVKAFDILFGEDATGIATSLQQTADGVAIYNVAGQRLSKVQKGINIINGKKILK